jgi:hypothetical protein
MTREEREFWKAVYLAVAPLGNQGYWNAQKADAAVSELRKRCAPEGGYRDGVQPLGVEPG